MRWHESHDRVMDMDLQDATCAAGQDCEQRIAIARGWSRIVALRPRAELYSTASNQAATDQAARDGIGDLIPRRRMA